MRKEIERLAKQYRFFHWHMAFPDVYHLPASGQTPRVIKQGGAAGLMSSLETLLGIR